MTAKYEVRDGIAVITLDNPPVNGLSHPTRLGIMDGLGRALEDAAVKGVVVTGAGRAFSGGADIREFNKPAAEAEPHLLTVIAALEQSPKPVVAAVHSLALGGGLELALGAHYRVAGRGAQIGLPEVKLGLLPGAGGTQRLPRVVGLERALNMIVTGVFVPSEKLADTRLFESVVEGDPVPAAIALAKDAAAKGGPYPLIRKLKVEHPNAQGYLGFARPAVAAASVNYPAPLKCFECVEAAALKPFDEGMKVEREGFIELVNSTVSKAMRHTFFAERAASKVADIGDEVAPRPVKKVAVVGAGTMGGGISMNFLNAGIPVTILENNEAALQRGLATIRKNYENSAKKGRFTAADVEKRMALLKPTMDYADLADADLFVEAVFEEYGPKEAVFKKLDSIAKPGAILASNTSTLDVNRIAGFTRRPADVLGTHFFSPANVMKLLELVRGAATAKDVLATALAVSKKIGKTAVVSGVCDGFIGNRMLEQYTRQAGWLLDEGALPQQVDRAVEKFGLAMGPFRMYDLAGNDIGWAIRKRRRAEKPDMVFPATSDLICEIGRFGQKTGAGWYDYQPGDRNARPSKVVEELILKNSAAQGVKRRAISDEEIVERLIFALVNEGAKILEEGIAAKASDIDIVYLSGYGFPQWRGGPMFYADTVGLYNVLRAIRRYARGYQGADWQPAPLLVQLAEAGKRFNG